MLHAFLFRKIICLCWTLIIGSTYFHAAQAEAGHQTKIIIPTWGLTLQENGEGLFNELLQFLFSENQTAIKLEYVAYEEALRRLMHGEAQCAYPIPKRALEVTLQHATKEDFIESHPVLISRSHVFSRMGDPILSSMASLNGKTLIQIRGENYNHNFRHIDAKLLNVASETEKVGLLLAGRGHAMIASMPDILYSFRALKTDALPYDSQFTLLDYPNSVTCRRTAATEALIANFNERIEQTLTNGSLRRFSIEQGIPENLIDDFLPPLRTSPTK